MTGTNVEVDPAVEVPPDETPAAHCPYCERPFRDERACALHVGKRHPDDATESEAGEYEAAREAEEDDLFYFHLGVVAALAVVYSLTMLAYMIALGSGYL